MQHEVKRMARQQVENNAQGTEGAKSVRFKKVAKRNKGKHIK